MVKKVRSAAEEKNADAAREALAKTIPLIQKAHAKGVYHRNTTARKISQLTRLVNSIK